MTYSVNTLEEMIKTANEKPGFIKAHWCGEQECEDKLKELAGVSSRCIPFEGGKSEGKCVCCGKPTDKLVYWGKAY